MASPDAASSAEARRLAGFVARLRCPRCAGAFAFAPAPADTVAPCGVLRCTCFAYPVVDGIPVLQRGAIAVRSIADDRVVADGPRPEALVALVEAGRGREALVDLLALPVCPWPLNLVGAARGLSRRPPFRTLGRAWRQHTLRRRLDRRAALTAEDWLAALYWTAPAPFDPFNYFFFRFGQPRHLAALALLAGLPRADAPVLDLACGCGHLLHALASAGHAAAGLDQNYHQVWIARHYVAPDADLVCADADAPLPFADASLAAALCADAFHYLHDKAGCVAELRRATGAAGARTLLLAGTGNALVGAPDGEELAPDAYVALFEPWTTRVRGEDELVAAYLQRRGPDLAAPPVSAAALGSKRLYLVATEEAPLPQADASWAAWPHGAGRLGLNPLYEERPVAGGTRLRFRFPSAWFARENAGMRAYHAPEAVLDAATRRSLERGGGGSDPGASPDGETLEALLASWVVLGLPERYARPGRRPLAMRGHRALTLAAARLRSRPPAS